MEIDQADPPTPIPATPPAPGPAELADWAARRYRPRCGRCYLRGLCRLV